MSRRVLGRVFGLIAAAGFLTLLVAGFMLRSTAHTDDGAICGSVWHWRQSSQMTVGGELADSDRSAISADCHRDAVPRYDRAMGLVPMGGALVVLGGLAWTVSAIPMWRRAA